MAAKIANPIKAFNFRVEINGVDQFEFQELSFPEAEIEVTEHGDTNHMIGTPGMISFTDMEIQKIRKVESGDDWAWDWLKTAQDAKAGAGSLPAAVKQTIVIRELAPDGQSSVNSYEASGCFCRKIGRGDASRTSSDNVIQTVTIWVDEFEQI